MSKSITETSSIIDVHSERHLSPEHRGAPLALEILPSSSRSTAMATWRKLESEFSNQRLTCSSIWTETWIETFGSLIPHQFAIAHRLRRPCGIALLTQGTPRRVGPFRLNTWHIGTAGENKSESVFVEYNTLLVRHRDRAAFSAALWDWAIHHTSCDKLFMDGFAAEQAAPLLALHPYAMVTRKQARFFDLDAVRTANVEPISRLGYHTRSAIRRTLRNLGQVRGEWADSPARAEEFMSELIQLHEARWNAVGKPGSYASPRFREFHLNLLHRAVPRGMMGLFRVTDGTQTVACTQILSDNNRALVYQGGWSACGGSGSPGLATDYLCLCECLRRGYDAYDFLAGDGEHKRRLSTDTADLDWIVWRRPNFKNALVDIIRRVRRAAAQLKAAAPSIPPA